MSLPTLVSRMRSGTDRSQFRIVSRSRENDSSPASVGEKSFSSGMQPSRSVCHVRYNSDVVNSYSERFHCVSSGFGRWYLTDGTTSMECEPALSMERLKNFK